MGDSIIFSRLMYEYGNLEQEKQTEKPRTSEGKTAQKLDEFDNQAAGGDLMQVEERNTGAVTWGIYSKYLRFAGGRVWAPVILLLLTLTEGAQGDLRPYV
jgi:ATP-binding cassette, subfamily C (CFTR/MRP), member 1